MLDREGKRERVRETLAKGSFVEYGELVWNSGKYGGEMNVLHHGIVLKWMRGARGSRSWIMTCLFFFFRNLGAS